MTAQSLQKVIDEFALNPIAYGRMMRQLFEASPEEFFEAALPILRTDNETHGVQYLVTLLLINDLIFQALSDPEMFSLPEAIHLARILLRVEPLLDIKIARSLVDLKDPNSKQELEERAVSAQGIRLLEILSTISDGARILPVMAQLLQHPNAWVRSKAALMVGRSNKNHKWVSQQLEESDPRVRANAVESLWGVDSEGSRNVFWGALADSDNRVVGNALLALYRLGEAGSIPLIVDLLKHDSVDFKVSGLWIMGESGDQRFLGMLARFFSDPAAAVRTGAFKAVAKLKKEAAKFSNVPAIDVHLHPVVQLPGGMNVSLMAWTDAADPGHVIQVTGLKATQFVIFEDSNVVTNYEIEEFSHTESNAIAFALPRVGDADSPFHGACVEGFDRSLRHKKKGDAWLVLKYLPEREKAAPVLRTRSFASTLRLEEPADSPASGIWPLPSETRFTADPTVITAAVAGMGTRMSIPPSLPTAAASLLAAVAQARGSRHLVLFQHPLIGDASSASWPELARQARLAKISIHTFGLEDCPQLQDLSEKTGGLHRRLLSVSELPLAIEMLCARLVNRYEIRYRSPQRYVDGAATVRIQIYSEQGTGEQTYTVDCKPQVPVAMAG